MKQGSRDSIIGLCSLGALLGIVALLLLFGELEGLINRRYVVTFHTTNAGKLRAGSNVVMNGVPIGVIDDIALQADAEYAVQVSMFINANVLIPSNVVPRVESPLIGGSANLHLDMDFPDDIALAHLRTDGKALISGPHMTQFDAITQAIDQRMQPLFASLERFELLSETYIQLGKNLNELVQPQSDGDINNGVEPNLRSAVLAFNDVLQQARSTLGQAEAWLGDEQMRSDVHEIVAELKISINNANTAIDRYTKLADSLQSDVNDVAVHMVPALDELGEALRQMRQVAHLAADGEGTVGQLLNNPDLYNSLDDAAIRLQQAVEEIILFLEKFRTEGIEIDW